MNKILLLFFVSTVCVSGIVKSQGNLGYAVQAVSGTYGQITGTTATLTATANDGGMGGRDEGFANALPIGFTFNYNGTNYTTLGACSNGFVYFGANITGSPTFYVNSLATFATSRPFIAPLWEDILISNIQYSTTGSAPNRVFTVQWTNAQWDYAAPSAAISFQLKLYETSNVFEFIYRQEAGAVTSGSVGASIGITATATGSNNYISLADVTAAPVFNTSTETTNILTKPATGQIFRWTPYCAASASATVERISNFTYNSINSNSTSTAGYVNLANLSTMVNLTPTSSLPFSATINGFVPTDQLVIFIDFNHNGDFNDPGETVFTSTTPLSSGTVTGNINIPPLSPAVLQGTTRIRLRLHDTNNGPNATSCGTSSAGQVQDFLINIQPCFALAVNSQPASTFICDGGNGTISVGTTGTGLTYQWQVSTNGGSSWTNLSATAPYSGVTSNSLTINGATLAMNGYMYRVNINGTCSPATTSSAATITINTAAAITTNPLHATACAGKNVTFTSAASGSSPAYQWQVSADGGITYSNLSGETNPTLTLSAVATGLNGNRYRAVATVTSCGAVNSSPAILTVNALPVVTINTAPIVSITPGVNTFISAGSVPTAASYSWTRNGSVVPGINSHSILVNASNLGAYRVTVTDVNGCENTSSPVTIMAEPSEKFWIYPNPSSGKFQVRLYSSWLSDIRTATIYNSQGAVVLKKAFTINTRYDQMDFDMTRFPSGIYTIHLTHYYVPKETVGRIIIAR
jgi:hypothetical protein